MYNLKKIKIDFPWTYNADYDDSPFEYLPPGWGDILYKYLVQINKLLYENNAEHRMVIEQVKEKFGTLRWYFCILDEEGFADYDCQLYKDIDFLVQELEQESKTVCWECGTTKNVKYWSYGWVHYACPSCEDKYNVNRK